MKILRKIVIVLLLIGGVGIGSGLLVSHYYGDEVEQAVINGLNDRLQVEVDVEKVNFSVLRKFPYASVSFFRSSLQRDGDTLFHFDRVHLQFDLIDLARGQERIDRISFEDGSLTLPIDERGRHPYDDLWKEQPDEEKKGSSFELDRLEWENVSFHYEDHRTNSAFRTRIAYAFLQGSFSDEGAELRAQVEGRWKELELGERAWKGVDREYSVRTQGRIDNSEERIRIGESSIEWADLEGEMDGSIEYGRSSRLDLKYRFPYHELQAYIDAWPGLLVEPADHGLEGRIRVEGEWKGPTGRRKGPVFRGELELKEGGIEHEGSGIRAEELRAEGRFSTRNDEGRAIIELDRFKGELGGGKWSGKGHFSPGSTDRVKLHLKGESSVQESVRFLGIDTVGRAEGQWSTRLRIEGSIPGKKAWSPEHLEQLSISGRAELEDATIGLKGQPEAFEKLNGSFILHGTNAAIRNFEGRYAGNELNLEGRFYDLLPYLFFPDQPLRVEAELRSPRIDLDPVLDRENGSSSEDYALEFPEDLRFKLQADLDSLSFRSFEARELSGSFELGPGGLVGKRISMKLADGKLNGNLALNAKSEPYGVRAGARLKGIRLKPLFHAFESFGQELIRPEHLRGIIDADVHYRSSLQKNLGVPPASVTSSADLEVRKGELIGLRPLIGLGEGLAEKDVLASFLDLDGLAERLHHVRFETLKNRIRVENEKVIIPRFDIRSSALDIKASGEHGFDGRIDHRFVILMDELLSKPKKSEFGYLREEGEEKRLFVRMKGTTEDPELSFDREAAREHRKQERKEEKDEVKDALRKEFGLFGGEDSLSTEKDEEGTEGKGEPAFDVRWGDEQKKKEKEKEEEKEEGKSLWDRLGIGKDEEDKEDKKDED